MLESIKLDYPPYFIILCLLLGLVVSFVLYGRNKQWSEVPTWSKTLMFILRTLGVASIAFLLLGPVVLRLLERSEEAIIVIAQDQSASLNEAVGSEAVKAINKQIDELQTQLGEAYKVERFGFGTEIHVEQDSILDQSTNISAALKYIDEQYADKNIGAVIMSTDGIFNEGRNPIYENVSFNAPLYTVALGDTTIKRDLLVKNVLFNKVAYLGDETEIQVDVQAFNSRGEQTSLKLYETIGDQQKLIEETRLNISSDPYFKSQTYTVKPSRSGNVKYTVKLSGLSDELSRKNNDRNIYIDVIDARQKVLLLAESPHPDLSAIKQSLEQNKNYELSIHYAKDKPIATNKANLVIFHNLPSANWDIKEELNVLNTQRTPRLFILGSHANYSSFNALDQGVSVSGFNQSMNVVEPKLNAGFNAFKLSDKVKQLSSSFPPIQSPFGEFNVASDSKILARQTVSSIETNYPLIVFNERNNVRKAVLLGEGIWKWRLFDFLNNENHEGFDELFQKIVQYTSIKEDKRQFRVNLNESDLKVGETILFDAQLYNELYQAVNDADVSINITNKKGQQYDFQFSKFNDYYVLDAGSLPEGSYNFEASTTYNGKSLTDKGSFTIKSIQKESYNLTANHSLLYELSAKFNGELLAPEELSSLAAKIKSSKQVKPVIYTEKDKQSILNFWWLMIPILLMLFVEWFLRRYAGNY